MATHRIWNFKVIYTNHGGRRARTRHIREAGIRAALLYGRQRKSRGAWVYQIDRRSLATAAEEGKDLIPFKGITVVATGDDRVVTVYRCWRVAP